MPREKRPGLANLNNLKVSTRFSARDCEQEHVPTKRSRPHQLVHPLMIDHIIENIFLRLGEPYLLRCRRVCEQWREHATKLYTKETEEFTFGEHEDNVKMEMFLRVMRRSNHLPLDNFKFDPAFFVLKNDNLFKEFLHLFGPSLSSLKLWFDNDCTMRFSEQCFPNLDLSNLKILTFNCINFRGKTSPQNADLTNIIASLLKAATNITKFSFSFPPKDFKCQQQIIKRFGNIVGTKLPRKVKNLKLDMRITDSQLQSLSQLELSLETLHFDFRGSKLKKSILQGFLHSQRNTLEELKISDFEDQFNYEIEFPRFEKLLTLEIQGGTVSKFSYQDCFPKLDKLILFGWRNEESLNSMFTDRFKSRNVKHVELPYKIRDPILVRSIGYCLPGLRKLEITPAEESFFALEAVLETMINLEELEITFPFIIEDQLHVDSVLTGIPKTECQRILTEQSFFTANCDDLKTHPSLTNLSKLKKLTIEDHSHEIILTDVTGYLALYKMKKLEVLEIGRFQMSNACFQTLTEKFKVTQTEDSSDESDIESDSDNT